MKEYVRLSVYAASVGITRQAAYKRMLTGKLNRRRRGNIWYVKERP